MISLLGSAPGQSSTVFCTNVLYLLHSPGMVSLLGSAPGQTSTNEESSVILYQCTVPAAQAWYAVFAGLSTWPVQHQQQGPVGTLPTHAGCTEGQGEKEAVCWQVRNNRIVRYLGNSSTFY